MMTVLLRFCIMLALWAHAAAATVVITVQVTGPVPVRHENTTRIHPNGNATAAGNTTGNATTHHDDAGGVPDGHAPLTIDFASSLSDVLAHFRGKRTQNTTSLEDSSDGSGDGNNSSSSSSSASADDDFSTVRTVSSDSGDDAVKTPKIQLPRATSPSETLYMASALAIATAFVSIAI